MDIPKVCIINLLLIFYALLTILIIHYFNYKFVKWNQIILHSPLKNLDLLNKPLPSSKPHKYIQDTPPKFNPTNHPWYNSNQRETLIGALVTENQSPSKITFSGRTSNIEQDSYSWLSNHLIESSLKTTVIPKTWQKSKEFLLNLLEKYSYCFVKDNSSPFS